MPKPSSAASAPPCNSASIGLPIPTDRIGWASCYGIQYEYKAKDSVLVAAGLLSAEQLPGSKFRCHRRFSQLRVSRLRDGNVRLVIDADIALSCDVAFKRFLGGLLADARLSLVKNEKGGAV